MHICIITNENWIWHLRYDHLNVKSLYSLGKDKMLSSLSLIKQPNKFREACLLGKQHRKPFQNSIIKKASSLLELVYSKVCGPLNH